MGLPARQSRMLERIEDALRGSDPKLAALYAIFARLNRDEEMPRREQLKRTARTASARLRSAPATLFSGHHIRLLPRQRAILFLPLALMFAVASIVYAAKSSSGTTCPLRPVASVSTQINAKSKLCRPPATMLSGFYLGK
jgi:hypothetical protein